MARTDAVEVARGRGSSHCCTEVILKLAWRPSSSSPKKSCKNIFVFISACFSNHFFSSRNSVLALLFSAFGIFVFFFYLAKKEKKHFAVSWLQLE